MRLSRNARQDHEGGRGLRTVHFATVIWDMLNLSFNGSPWVAPHSGLTRLIWLQLGYQWSMTEAPVLVFQREVRDAASNDNMISAAGAGLHNRCVLVSERMRRHSRLAGDRTCKSKCE